MLTKEKEIEKNGQDGIVLNNLFTDGDYKTFYGRN